MNSDADAIIPNKTADYLDVFIPSDDGTPVARRVWIQTLNTVHRGKAENDAQFATARSMKAYRKGEEGYSLLSERFESLNTDELLEFIAGVEARSGKFVYLAYDKFPDAVKPTRDKAWDDSKWLEITAAYDVEVEAVNSKRIAFIDKQFEDFKKAASKWTVATKLDRAIKGATAALYNENYNVYYTTQALYYAVRKADAHAERFFPSIDAVEDLPDEARDELINKYKELDNVRPTAVPT